MKLSLNRMIAGMMVAIILSMVPVNVKAQEAREGDGAFFLGSMLFSILHYPLKLATCVGTQAGAAVFYTATFGVPGHYEGGTNGKDIGETARRSCTGSWLIGPDQVKKDYGE